MAVDDANTIILLHFNGSDASTTFTDESGKVWTAAAEAQLDTAQKKFGTASGLFDGTGDYISTPYHADFDLGNSDWTIDFWLRNNSGTYPGFVQIGSGNNLITVYYYGTTLRVRIGSTASSPSIFTWTIVNGTWVHIAIVKINATNAIKAYINGVDTGDGLTNTNHPTIVDVVTIGLAELAYLNGWIDELRISKVARWTENFTPPTVEYATQVPIISVANFQVSPSISGQLIKGYIGDIYSSILISPSISGQLLKGRIGDISSSILISPQVSGTMEYIPPPELSCPISISPQISGTMESSIVGNGSIIIPIFTLSATGVRDDFGNLEVALPFFRLNAEGFDSCIGEAFLTIPILTLLGLGTIDEIGEVFLTIPMLRLSATGGVDVIGYGSINIPMIALSAETIIGEIGDAALSLPLFKISGEGVDGAIGEGAIVIPFFTLASTGMLSAEGIANVSIPMFKLFSEFVTATGDYLNLAMNIRNNALTVYSNYPFNSFCRFNGVHLGAMSSKIYNLGTGITDNGTLIFWSFKTAYIDLEFKIKKKLRQAWLTLKTDGDLILTVSYPDGTSYEYSATSYGITEDGIRVKFGKGIKSRYVALEVESVDGSTLELDAIRLQLDQYTAKR